MQWDNNRTNFDRNLAVVIGIDRYDSRGIHDLQTAVSDANAIANLLRDEYGYKDEHIVRLFSPKNDEATLKALHQPYCPATLKELRILLTDTLSNHLKPTPADRLLFYFAGHGIPRNSKDGPAGYLVPQTAEQGNPASFLPMRELHDALSKLECHHLLVILDCCFAGTFRWASSRKAIPILETVHKEHYDRFIRYPAWQVLTSAAHDQEALDLSIDQRGSAIKDTRHSPFALALIEGLRDNKADVIQDKVITAHELYLYLDGRVNELSREMQTPGIYPMRLDYDRGEYIFTRPGFKRDDLTEAPPLNEENNPYRGLKPFEERHSRFFFGRKALVEALSHRLAQSRRPLTVVLGASGSGKSSLVQAGLLPHLREKQEKEQQAQRWYILDPMRPGKSPFTELARTLLPVANSKLIAQLAKVSFLDKTFAEIIDPNSEQKQKAASPNPTQPDSREERSGDEAFDATKLAECWNHAEPEAKLLLVVDYFAQLQGFCHQPQEQEQLSSLYRAIEQTLNRLTQALQQEPQSFTHLMAIWSQVNPSTKLLLVIDQFEELITMSQDDRGSGEQSDSQEPDEQKEWQRFLSLLRMALAKYRRQLHIVLTLRSDFEPRFLNSALKGHWKSARFPVRAMNSDELRDAIEGPALKQALYFEPPELVGKLIDEVGQMPGALPLLSFTLSELYIKLYERWTKNKSTDRALRIKDYEELGGVAGALTRRASEEYDNLVRDFGEASGKAYQATMRRVMLRMVTIEGGGVTRRRVPESELVYPDAEENKCVAQVSARLVKARLLVKGQETGEPYVEPSHDFLVRSWDKLQEWIKAEQEDLTLQHRLTPAANDWKHGIGMLWLEEVARLAKLEKVLESEINNWLNELETEFVTRSIHERQDRIKKLEEDLQISEQRRVKAEVREKAARAENLLPIAPDAGLRLTIQAMGQNLNELPNEILTPTRASLLQAVRTGLIARQSHVPGSYGYGHTPIYQNSEFVCLIAGYGDYTRQFSVVYILDLRKGIPSEFSVGQSNIIAAISPNSQMIATGGSDLIIKIWDLQGNSLGSPINLDIQRENGCEINCIAFSLDGQMIAVGYQNGIEILDLNGNSIGQYKEQNVRVLNIKFSPDDKRIIGGCSDGNIRIWNLQEIPVVQLEKAINANDAARPDYSCAINCIALSSDGKLIASSGADWKIHLWDFQGNLIAIFSGHRLYVRDIAFSPDNQLIASGSQDETVRLWDLKGNQLCMPWETLEPVKFVSFSSDGKTIFSSGAHGSSYQFDCQRDAVGLPFLGHTDAVTAVAVSPNGQLIASSSKDHTVRLWDLPGKPVGQPFQGHTATVTYVTFSPDGQTIASGSEDKTVCLWDLKGNLIDRFIQTSSNDYDYFDGILSINFSPDGQLIAISGVGLLNWQNLQSRTTINVPLGWRQSISSITFTKDYTIIGGGQIDKHYKLIQWDLQGNPLRNQALDVGRFDRGIPMAIALSPDNQYILVAGGERPLNDRDGFFKAEPMMQLWNLQTGVASLSFQGHSEPVTSVAFSPDGQTVVSGSEDNTVRLWDLQGNQIGHSFVGHTDKVTSVAFTPDGQFIVSGSRDGTIRLWRGGWQEWLRICCKRLWNNPQSIADPERFQTSITAQETCLRYVWSESDADLDINGTFNIIASGADVLTEEITHWLKSSTKLVVDQELKYLQAAINSPQRPLAAIIGGRHLSGKYKAIEVLLEKVDKLFICGELIFAFYKARGLSVGELFIPDEYLEMARMIEAIAKKRGVELLLPIDVVVSNSFPPDVNNAQTVSVENIPDGMKAMVMMDIGPASVELFQAYLSDCKTVVMSGWIGDSIGVEAIVQTLEELTKTGTTTIIGHLVMIPSKP